jgi:hypothetical protein
MMTIFFDMDGTIADLYGVENWLDYLRAEDATPYREAETLVNMQALAHRLNNLQRKGYKVEVISWLARESSESYGYEVANAKIEWLNSHLKSVHFDKINIVPYGTEKDTFRHSENDILFDDEEYNRENWGGVAYNVDNILKILRGLK